MGVDHWEEKIGTSRDEFASNLDVGRDARSSIYVRSARSDDSRLVFRCVRFVELRIPMRFGHNRTSPLLLPASPDFYFIQPTIKPSNDVPIENDQLMHRSRWSDGGMAWRSLYANTRANDVQTHFDSSSSSGELGFLTTYGQRLMAVCE